MAQQSRPAYVVELNISRHFGGREEGGWWYDHTDVVAVHRCASRQRARRLRNRLRAHDARYSVRYNRFSVLGGTDVVIVVVHSQQEVDDLQTRGRPIYC